MKKTLLGLCIVVFLVGNIYAGGLYSGGSGTAADPYKISTEADLYNVRNNLSSYFILMNNIDLGEGAYFADPGWTPIGPIFTGNFNGNGHIINYLKINNGTAIDQGLFSYLSGATITKLGITRADVTGSGYVGILAAAAINGCLIDQCWTSGVVNTANNSSAKYAGGLVGSIEQSTISNSYSVATVSSQKGAGGLIGYSKTASIINCYAYGHITFGAPVGGLVAVGVDNTITNCFWNTDTQGVVTSDGGTGISSVTMKTQSTFTNAGWSSTVWKLDARINSGFPYLSWDNSAAPNEPVATVASLVTQTSFVANWNASPGAIGYSIDVATDIGFTSMVAGFSNKDMGNVTTYSVTGLSSLTTYYYRIRAYNAISVSASSNIITAETLPAAPGTIAATFVGNTSFSANWNALAKASGYFLDVATNATFTSMVTGFSNKDVGNVTTYSVTGLTAGITYYYRVRAYGTGGATVSTYSNTITVATVPPIPVATSATAISQSTLNANWNTSAGATGYYLDVATDIGFASMVQGFTNRDVGNITTYSVTGLTPLTTYYYRISAYNTGGASASSNIITVETLPAAPVALAATSVNNSSFIANWNSVSGIIGYKLQVDTNPSFSSPFVDISTSTNLSYTINTGVQPGITYYYRVASYTSSQTSAWSNTITLTTLPNTPVAVSASSITTTSFSANWNSATGASGYYLDVSTDNTFAAFITGYNNKDVSNVTSYTLSGLTVGTTYYYRVRAYNSGSVSYNSNVISVPLAPNAPVASAATLIKQTSFSLNWNAITGADGYYIDLATDNTFTSFVSGYISKDVSNVTTYSLSGLSAGTTYYYRVRAYNLSGISANSNLISVVTLPFAPSAPVAVAASLIGQISFNLNWNPLSGAAGYYIDVATDNAFTSFVSGYNNKDAGSVTTYTISGLTAGTTYYYRVRGYNLGGVSTNSNVIAVITLPPAPSAPVAVAATLIKQTSFSLNWIAVSGADGYFIDVAIDNAFTSFVSGYNNKDAGNVTSFALSALSAGTTYYYRVRAYNSGGVSNNSNIISLVTLPPVPNAPVAVAASLVKQTSFNLNWNTLSGVSGYYIDVATDNAFTSFVSGYNGKDAGNVTTYALSGLSAGTSYYYRVRAYNSGGMSNNSNVIFVVTLPLAPNTPVAVAATLIKQTSFTLNWNILSGADGYFIDVATDNAFTAFVSGYNGKDAGNITSYTLSGLTAGTTYYYRVRGYNSGGVSPNSNIISVITLPLAPNTPVAVAATLIKQTSFTLNWNTLSGADGYYFDVATDNAFTAFVPGYNNKDAGNVTTYELNGLTAGTTYYYRVRGYNTGGVSTSSNIISAVTLPLAPNTPVAVAATLIKQTSFSLNWNALSGAAGYYVDVATDNAFTAFVSGYNNKDAGNVTTLALSGLTANTKYYYRVRGYNSGGTSSNSNIISVTTLPLAPGAPVAVAATLIKQTSFSLNWNTLSGADGYYFDVATDNAFTAFVSGYNNKDAGNVTTYELSGLTAGTTYYYRVRGYNTGGISTNSNIISTVTLPAAPIAPVAVAASLVKQTSFNLNWNALSGADGYYVDVATDNAFTTFVSGYNNKDAGNVTTLALSGLTPNTKYYYRVRGYNVSGAGVNSNIITVTTLQIVSNAPIARPASSVTQVSFVANWNLVTSADGYYIDVATDNAFSSILPAYNNKDVGNVTTAQVTGLTVGTTYYYRLRAYNTGGQSVNSIIISVTTILTVPDPPVATAGTLIGGTSFTANWNISANATGYYIDVAKDLLFTTYVNGYSLRDVGNVLTIPVTGLTAGTTYYFRVVGYNSSGIGQYSNVITVTLKTTGIDQIAGMPSTYKLNQNYPNPFNPTTKIRFEIPSESFVRVKIYDAVGREVKELANEQKSAGIYEINFVATDLPSGIYIFRLQADSNGKIYSETRKMILMK